MHSIISPSVSRLLVRQEASSMSGKTDLDLYLYSPNHPLAIVFAVFFFLALAVHVALVCRHRSRTSNILGLVIGLLVELLAQVCRTVNLYSPSAASSPIKWWLSEEILRAIAIPLFVTTTSGLLISAMEDMVAAGASAHRSALRGTIISCEIVASVLQIIGTIVWVLPDDTMSRGGELAIVAGSGIQLVSFLIFVVALLFVLRKRDASAASEWTVSRVLVLLLAEVFIALRSSTRFAEYYMPRDGILRTQEAFYYGLQAAPMLLVAIALIPFSIGSPTRKDRRPRSSLTSTHAIGVSYPQIGSVRFLDPEKRADSDDPFGLRPHHLRTTTGVSSIDLRPPSPNLKNASDQTHVPERGLAEAVAPGTWWTHRGSESDHSDDLPHGEEPSTWSPSIDEHSHLCTTDDQQSAVALGATDSESVYSTNGATWKSAARNQTPSPTATVTKPALRYKPTLKGGMLSPGFAQLPKASESRAGWI